jgi:hypothetical protein
MPYLSVNISNHMKKNGEIYLIKSRQYCLPKLIESLKQIMIGTGVNFEHRIYHCTTLTALSEDMNDWIVHNTSPCPSLKGIGVTSMVIFVAPTYIWTNDHLAVFTQ